MADKHKICLVASAGGHLTQLLKLSECWQDHEAFYISTTEVIRQKLSQYGKVCIVGECNHQRPLRVLATLIRCFKIVVRERPDVVITTGAAVGCVTCFLGKLFGAKIVWIDSVTNVEKLSLSGKMVRHIADLFLVQWPELAKQYKNVEYLGAVI
jgi:UDP-N-acetylglucosamine:LPS N-acetylglucosamine transferase